MQFPTRQAADGPVHVNRPAENEVSILVTHDGDITSIRMSEYNAWRVFVMLAVLLGIPLPKAVSKFQL